jgi:beta-lactamase class A
MRLLACTATFLSCFACAPSFADARDAPDFAARISAIESRAGGRIGVAAIDTSSGRRLQYHADQRFALCSTYKLLLVAAIFSRVDGKEESPDRSIPISNRDLVDYAPVVSAHMRQGAMTVFDLCAAAVQYSDNSAANLLLRAIEGPRGLTRYLRSLGDSVTRLDRNEPSLNSNLPGDERDTTTPNAMLNLMQKILLQDALSPASGQKLLDLLIENKTGAARLRAGMDPAWKVGSKSGSGDNGATNDVAVVWPERRPPIVIAVYYTDSPVNAEARDSVVASAGREVCREFLGSQK